MFWPDEALGEELTTLQNGDNIAPEKMDVDVANSELRNPIHIEKNNGDVVSKILYHGCDRAVLIEDIKLPGPRATCDFGSGFYLTESKRVAAEWVARNTTPVLNRYTFTANKNEILYLTGEAWLRVVVGFRTGKYKVFLKSPVICGIIANDRMDISLLFFLRGEIGDQRLFRCLDLCKLGNQYLLRQIDIFREIMADWFRFHTFGVDQFVENIVAAHGLPIDVDTVHRLGM